MDNINSFALSKSSKDAQINAHLADFKKELAEIFGEDLPNPFVLLLNSREEIDAYWEKKTEPWLVGWTTKRVIFILDPDVFAVESEHTYADAFWKVLRHEYCHICFENKTDINYPKWLNEGLACYLAGQKKPAPTLEQALEVARYFRQQNKDVYTVGYFWVSRLIKKFGIVKMKELIALLGQDMTEAGFKEAFLKVFAIAFSREGLMQICKDVAKK